MTQVIEGYGTGIIPKNTAKIMLVAVLGLEPAKDDEMLASAEVSPLVDDDGDGIAPAELSRIVALATRKAPAKPATVYPINRPRKQS